MPLTTLDKNTALIIIDLQKGIAGYPMLHPLGEIVQRANALIDAFHRHGLPVVLVNVTGGSPGRTEQGRHQKAPANDAADFLPELHQEPQDHKVTKRTRGAFTHTDLEMHLKSRGVTQVVIAGIATSSGVESTARHAYELGFHVTLVIDAMTDGSFEPHDYSIKRIFPKLGETGTTQDVVETLDKRSP